MKSWIHFLGGSVSVYLLMAACSAAGSHHGNGREQSAAAGKSPASENGGAPATSSGGDTMANAGTSAPNGPGGDATTSGGMIADVIDDMMDPVGDADAAPATSGSRLRAVYYSGEDGSRQFIGWHDKERNEDCSFQIAEDGKLRCMPSVGAYALNYFADEACANQPVTLVTKAAAACTGVPAVPRTLYVSDTCGGSRSLYTVGQTPVSMVYQKGTGTCVAMQQAVLDLYNFYPLTSPVAAPASAFVAAVQEVE